MFPLWTKTDMVPTKQTNTENNCATVHGASTCPHRMEKKAITFPDKVFLLES